MVFHGLASFGTFQWENFLNWLVGKSENDTAAKEALRMTANFAIPFETVVANKNTKSEEKDSFLVKESKILQSRENFYLAHFLLVWRNHVFHDV